MLVFCSPSPYAADSHPSTWCLVNELLLVCAFLIDKSFFFSFLFSYSLASLAICSNLIEPYHHLSFLLFVARHPAVLCQPTFLALADLVRLFFRAHVWRLNSSSSCFLFLQHRRESDVRMLIGWPRCLELQSLTRIGLYLSSEALSNFVPLSSLGLVALVVCRFTFISFGPWIIVRPHIARIYSSSCTKGCLSASEPSSCFLHHLHLLFTFFLSLSFCCLFIIIFFILHSPFLR
jgi:hypothetical protein